MSTFPRDLWTAFFAGITMLGSLTIAVFFRNFARRTGDPLFGYFAFAFLVMGVERFVLMLAPFEGEAAPFVYLLRLTAFVIIGAGIVRKNRV